MLNYWNTRPNQHVKVLDIHLILLEFFLGLTCTARAKAPKCNLQMTQSEKEFNTYLSIIQ